MFKLCNIYFFIKIHEKFLALHRQIWNIKFLSPLICAFLIIDVFTKVKMGGASLKRTRKIIPYLLSPTITVSSVITYYGGNKIYIDF